MRGKTLFESMLDNDKKENISLEEAVKILIIDDSEYLRKKMVKALDEAGFNVVGEAQEPKEAMEALNSTKANLIIIDVVMPDVNGIEFARLIKENFSDVYIIMVSSLGHEHIILDALSAGALDFLVKPFNNEALVESVRKIADQIREEMSY